jgi:hypothetical protein
MSRARERHAGTASRRTHDPGETRHRYGPESTRVSTRIQAAGEVVGGG